MEVVIMIWLVSDGDSHDEDDDINNVYKKSDHLYIIKITIIIYTSSSESFSIIPLTCRIKGDDPKVRMTSSSLMMEVT